MSGLLVKLALELGDGGVLFAVAALGVEHLEERRKDRVLAVGAPHRVRLASDVEENALRRRADHPLDKALQERQLFLAFAERDEYFSRLPVADLAVFDHRSKNLEKVGLTGTEETGYPSAVRVPLVVVLEEGLEV